MDIWLIQLVGAIGYTFLALSYYKKEKSKILFMQIIAYLLFTLHYFALSGITGAICNFIGLFAVITIYLFDKYNWNGKKIAAFILIFAQLIANIMTFQNIFSIFPLIASIIVIISFIGNDEDAIRKIGIIAAVCWLIYAIECNSYVTIVFEVVTLTGVVVALIKNSKKTE